VEEGDGDAEQRRDQVQQIRLLHNATSLVEVREIEDESG